MTENPKRRFEDRIQAKPLDWNDAQSEQSSTAGAAKGGNTSDNGSQASSVLTDERIFELWDQAFVAKSASLRITFARSIEAEVLAQAGVRAEPVAPVQTATKSLEVLDWTRDGMIDGTEFVRLDDVRTLFAEPVAYMIRDKRESARFLKDGANWKPCSIEDYELRKEHTDIFEFRPVYLAAPALPAQVPAAEVRAQVLDTSSVLDMLWQRVTEAREAAYTFGDTCKEAVEIALDGVLDLLVQADLAQSSTADKASEVRAAEWISVEDARKPEERKPVLLFVRTLTRGEDDDGRPYETEGEQVEMGEYRFNNGSPYFSCFTSPMSDNDWITHWMELPAAPSTADSGNTSALGDTGGAK